MDPSHRERVSRARGYDQLRAGGWDPKLRLADQDIDGVCFEVLYPSMAMPMFAIPDSPLQRAVFRAYNNWVAEYAAAAPDRLLGVALIPLDDVEAGVTELGRARSLGLRGAMIWNDPGPGRGPFLESYMTLTHAVQRSLAAQLTSGVFDRHPGLRVVSVENDIGWLAHFLYRLEHAFAEFRYMVGYESPLSPVESAAMSGPRSRTTPSG